MHDIVLIEDNDTDVDLLSESFAVAGLACRLHVARDGMEGMRLAEGLGSGDLVPALVVLDLNLPGYGGLEILARLRSHEALAKVPIIVMSGSLNPKDREAALARGATLFLAKPHDLDGFLAHGRLMKTLVSGADPALH